MRTKVTFLRELNEVSSNLHLTACGKPHPSSHDWFCPSYHGQGESASGLWLGPYTWFWILVSSELHCSCLTSYDSFLFFVQRWSHVGPDSSPLIVFPHSSGYTQNYKTTNTKLHTHTHTHTQICILLFRFFYIIGYYKILNTVPVLCSRSLLFICFINSCMYLLITNS